MPKLAIHPSTFCKANSAKETTFFCAAILDHFQTKMFVFLLILPYKTWWKPRFPMNQRPLVEGYIVNIGISLDVFEFLRFGRFFPFFEKFGFLGILGPPYCGIGATIRIGRDVLCLPYVGFFEQVFFLHQGGGLGTNLRVVSRKVNRITLEDQCSVDGLVF